MKPLYLVSRSPRRIDLLRRYRYTFQVVPSKFREERIKEGKPDIALKNARNKLEKAENRGDGIYLASDTIVYMDGMIFGKPESIEEAREFLRRLSGREHHVFTGLAIKESSQSRIYEELVDTLVKFKYLEDEEIELILKVDNPLDKAGAYAIQGIAGLFVERLSGSYLNVVGLPMERIYPVLKRFGLTPVLPLRNPPHRISWILPLPEPSVRGSRCSL